MLFPTLILFTFQGFTQNNVAKPTMGQIQSGADTPPGTIKIKGSLLEQVWKDTSCQQEMKQVGFKVLQVMAEGSGLINPLSAGDSLNIRIMGGMEFSKDRHSEMAILLLKEQLCTFEETYFTLIRKE